MEKQKLLDLASSDLNSSKVLYKSENYHQSVFHMQQSVEKLGKFLALSLGVHTEKDLRSIGHDALKIYKEALAYYINLVNTLSDRYESEKIDLTTIQDQFRTITDIDLLNLDGEHLDMMLESLAESEKSEIFFDMDQENTDLLDQFFELTYDLKEITEEEMNSVKSQYHTNPIFKTMIDEKFDGFFKTFPGYIAASQSAFLLAVVFTRHAVSTRYVINENDPLSTYTINNPLVSRLPMFQDYLEISINRCIDYVKYSD